MERFSEADRKRVDEDVMAGMMGVGIELSMLKQGRGHTKAVC